MNEDYKSFQLDTVMSSTTGKVDGYRPIPEASPIMNEDYKSFSAGHSDVQHNR